MIIVLWIASMIFIAVILGEIKYRQDIKERKKINKEISKKPEENIDTDIDKLDIEYQNNQFVPLRRLSMRGSWRLAQNQIMDKKMFHSLLKEEYTKKL